MTIHLSSPQACVCVCLIMFLTTIVESCRKAKPLLRCVCLSLIRRTLEGERVANGAKADKMVSTGVCGPRFLSIRAGVGEDERILYYPTQDLPIQVVDNMQCPPSGLQAIAR